MLAVIILDSFTKDKNNAPSQLNVSQMLGLNGILTLDPGATPLEQQMVNTGDAGPASYDEAEAFLLPI